MTALLTETSALRNLSRTARFGHLNGKSRHLWIASMAVLLGCSGGGSAESGAGGSTGAAGSSAGGTTGGPGNGGSTGVAGSAGVAGSPGHGGSTGVAGSPGSGGSTSVGGSSPSGRGGSTGVAGATGVAGSGPAGRGGSTGSAGSPGTGGGVSADQSVLERNKNPSRDGHFIQPTLTKAAAMTMTADTAFNTAATFTGNVGASPVYLDAAGGGLFFIPTTGGDVVARKENGTMQWTRNIGAPATSGIGCSSFATAAPLGILATPAIDAQTRTIYVAGAIGNAQGVSGQIASAINIDDGTVKSGWPVNVHTAASFDPKLHNQRSALSLVNGILYVPYAGYVGDCGDYHGRVVAINTANPTMVGQWIAQDRGDGIWASGGLASDGTGVFAATGNATGSLPATHADSEQLVRITGMGTKADFFYAPTWTTMDMKDLDLGAVNPMVITVPGATPSKMVVAISKDGKGFLLDAEQLRGTKIETTAGGQKAMFTLANSSMGMDIYGAPASYRTANGTYVVISASNATGCPNNASGRQVMAFRIAPNPLAASIVWCSPMSGGPTNPIATTTDGTNDAIVWFTSSGNLKGVDGDTGTPIYSSTNSCANVQKWTSPIAVKGRIITAGNGRLCAWGVPGALTQAPPAKALKQNRKLATASFTRPY